MKEIFDKEEFIARRLEFIISCPDTPDTRSYLISFLKEEAMFKYFGLLQRNGLFDSKSLQERYLEAAIFTRGLDGEDPESVSSVLTEYSTRTGITLDE